MIKNMEFKKLELQEDKKSFISKLQSPHLKKTLIAIGIGAIAGFGFFYLSEGQHMEQIVFNDVLKSTLIGGFFGFFITNSPCARNKC